MDREPIAVATLIDNKLTEDASHQRIPRSRYRLTCRRPLLGTYEQEMKTWREFGYVLPK